METIEQMLKALSENQSSLIQIVGELRAENAEMKDQIQKLPGTNPEKKKKLGENEVSEDMKQFIEERAAKRV